MHEADIPRDRALDAYLARLAATLTGISAGERREILLETRSHVLERTARLPFPSAEEVLAQLGAAETYAKQFSRLEAGRPSRPTALAGLARLAAGGWTSLPLLLVAVSVYGAGILAFIVGVVKVVSPDEVGVWMHDVDGRRQLFHAGFNSGLGGQEVMGYRLAAIAFGIAVILFLAMSTTLRWFARRARAVS